jgi:hypothetical protein
VLRGSERLLGNTMGIQVEVEFSPMYVDQPLFSDVDAYLRPLGFQLFDLSRYRVRRPTVDASVPSRGQLLWGHALYLRRPDTPPQERAARLAVVAALAGVPDYAAEILERVAAATSDGELRRMATRALTALRGAARDPDAERILLWRD